MTREEARKAAEVMLAYAEGKEVEFRKNGHSIWIKISSPLFNWSCGEYRIKQEPAYRPFRGKEECWAEMQKHQPFGWLMDKNKKSYHSILLLEGEGDSYEHLFKHTAFADGTPFGVKLKE